MAHLFDLTDFAFNLLQDIVRAEYGEFNLNIPGNDDELKALWGHGLIDSAPASGAPYRFVVTEKFDLFFEVKAPAGVDREPRFADTFIIVPR